MEGRGGTRRDRKIIIVIIIITLQDESYLGPAVDTWALGVLLYFILTTDMPFKVTDLHTYIDIWTTLMFI